MNTLFDMFDKRIGYNCISNNSCWADSFLVVVHGFCSIVPCIIFLIGIEPCLLFSSDMVVVVVATESWVALKFFSILIDVGVVVELTGLLESLVLSRNASHGLVLFQIQ